MKYLTKRVSFAAICLIAGLQSKEKTPVQISKAKSSENQDETIIYFVIKTLNQLEQIIPQTKEKLNVFSKEACRERLGKYKAEYEQIKNTFEQLLSRMSNKALKEKMFSDLKDLEQSTKDTLIAFNWLKIEYKIMNFLKLCHDFGNIKLNQSIEEKTKDCFEKLKKIIKKFDKIDQTKQRIPSKLPKIISEAKIFINNEENEKQKTDSIITLLFLIVELETEFKYMEVTDYLETQKDKIKTTAQSLSAKTRSIAKSVK